MNTIIRRVILLFIVVSTASGLYAHTLTSLASTPTPGANDISQLATSNTISPDGLNYYTDNNPIAGQTFTTGPNPMNLLSLSVKTAGLNSGGGYGTPATTPTYYLRIYSISGSTATQLITLSSPNPGFTDGDWLKWSGMKVPLEANKTYAFTCGIRPGNGGWAALAVAANAYAGGEIAMIPVNGGTITTGASHSFDAAFTLDLEPFPPAIPATMPLPTPTYGFNLGNTFESTWGFPSPTQAVLVSAANAGFNAVRIPCAWDFNADPNTYQINPAYMAQVKQAVDWAIAAGMYVVVNCHWDGGWLDANITPTVDPTVNAKMNAYWTQIATTFAGYDNCLLFAAANEPPVDSPAEMNTLMVYYQTFVDAVRGVGGSNTNRWLVLQSVSDPSWMNTLPTDSTPNRLMVEYHCYTPSLFTIIHTDQSWGDAIHYWGAAYHYSGNPSRNAVWPEEGAIDSEFQKLTEQYVSKGIPVLIGEFQAAGTGGLTGQAAAYNTASTLYWNKYVVDSAHAHGLSPFYWSTPDSPFNYDTGAITNPEVVNVLTGGTAPPPPNGAPYAATGLAATAGTGQVSLSWNGVAGATSYNLYRSAQSGYQPATPFVTGITGTSYTDTGLNGGTTYYYQVVAVNSSGPSGFSPEARATTPGVNPDPTQYHFETDTQRWWTSGSQIAGIATSTAQEFAGNQSLAVSFNGNTAGTSSTSVSDVVVAPGTTISFRVWIPSGHKITAIEPYLNDYNWAWASSWYGNLTANTWNTITLTVPSGHTAPLKQLGLRFSTNAAWTATCHVDSVSWTVPGSTSPPAPASLVALAGNAQVGLTWNASSGATSYNVKRATVSGGPYSTITSVTGTSFTNTGLVNGTTYYYVVSAVNASGESSNSAQASATPTAPSPPPTPGGLAATAGNAQVGLTWSASSGATSYNVKRATVSGGPYSTITSVSGTSFTNTGLVNGTTYYYVVSAVNASGESGNSTQSSATPQMPAPPAPTGLAATSGNTQVALTWNTASGATSYNVKRATVNGGPYSTITSVTGTSFTDTGLANGTTYYYVVSALSTGGESPNSAQASATSVAPPAAPPTPGGLAATAGNAQVGLTWNASSGATSYNVKRATVNGGPYSTITNITGTSFTNTGLANGTTYYYVVSALNAGGESGNSTQASATPSAPLPSPWATADIGAVAATGSASASGGTFTVTGSGADIWDSADEFRYVHQPSSGNCEMRAQVSTVQNTDPWAKAGVMIRESTAAGARYAAVFISPGNGVTFQRRTATGGTTVNTVVAGVTAPRYVRLQRAANNSFRAYYSSNGTSWTQIGANQTISIASSATMGLAVTSHNDGTLCTSTINNVTATP